MAAVTRILVATLAVAALFAGLVALAAPSVSVPVSDVYDGRRLAGLARRPALSVWSPALDHAAEQQLHRIVGRARSREQARQTATRQRQLARAARGAPARSPAAGPWLRLAKCESGGDPRAISPSGRYRGLLQFDLSTWASVGFTGDPIDYSAAEQLRAAKILQSRRGWSPWPACAKKLGLIR